MTIRTPGGREVTAPIWILPGHADRSLTLHLGYGRRRAGQVGNGAGVDAYVLRTTAPCGTSRGRSSRRPAGAAPSPARRTHHSMEGRNLARSGTLAAYTADPNFATHAAGHGPAPGAGRARRASDLALSRFPAGENAWGMVVDLGACTGCNACVVACQAENNIPIVGKDQVLNGREMHWMRIDRYFTGAARRSRDRAAAGHVHALRASAVRGGVSGGGHEPLLRGPERDDLQPLRRHPLLRQQLPVQGAPLQLLSLRGARSAGARAPARTPTSRCAPAG